MSAWTWIKGAAKISTGGLSSLYLYGGLFVAGAAAFAGAAAWHGAQVKATRETAFKAGQTEVQARWDKATQEATAVQAAQNQTATTAMTTEVEVIRTVYQDRIKEVTRYVPQPDTHCPADPDFVRLFNGVAASPAGEAADQ